MANKGNKMNPVTQMCVQEILMARSMKHGLEKLQSYYASDKTPKEFKDRIQREMGDHELTQIRFLTILKENLNSEEEYNKIVEKLELDTDDFLLDLSDEDDAEFISIFDMLNNI